MSEPLEYRVEDGVATLTLARPEKRNAMTFAMLRDFQALVARAGADPAVRVLILTGSGGSFCAGTDLSDLSNTPRDERGTRGRSEASAAAWPLVACPKPVIAAVDGPAVGLGAELTSQCDVRIASDGARFAWNFALRGLVPDTGAGSWLLPRLIGVPRALRLLYSGEFLSAAEALAIGYVADVVPAASLAARARAEAELYLRASPLSQRLIKELVYAGLARDADAHLASHARALAACFASEDHREGVAAFLERRAARFTGR
jgi:enoyl-CoA hydratase